MLLLLPLLFLVFAAAQHSAVLQQYGMDTDVCGGDEGGGGVGPGCAAEGHC
jgi:hypothetical protein